MSGHIQFTDVTLRDGQQSLAATRMSTPQMLRVLNILEDAGYSTLELWGGATLDSCVRFLDENPWERLEQFSAQLGHAKVQALLRGQNLFGYQPYPDDLVRAFVNQAVQSGVEVMRIFDALNDLRNLTTAIEATKASGAIAEAAISYTTSPVHTPQLFIQYAHQLAAAGADQLVIKDMAGLMHPCDTLEMVRSIKREINLPLAIHSHTTTGVGLLNAVVGMMYGADSIDCAITPFAGGTSHSPVEVLIVFAEEMGLNHGLDKELVMRAQGELFKIFAELRGSIPNFESYSNYPVTYEDIDRYAVQEILRLLQKADDESLESALDLSRDLLQDLGYPDYDARMFESQIPGGMLTNLQNQLAQMGNPGALEAVMEEIPRVRADVGYVPLVTPTSQIVGSQAVFNVMMGERYAIVSNEFKMLVHGEFGKSPVPPNAEVIKKVLGENTQVLQNRPAYYLDPVMGKPVDLPYVKTEKDVLLHHMLGQAADDYLARHHQPQIDWKVLVGSLEF